MEPATEKPPQKPARTPAQREADLVVVARLYLERHPVVKIVEWLNDNRPYRVRPGQVQSDLTKIRTIWLTECARLVNERKAEELAKLDLIEAEAWQAWHNSKRDSKRTFARQQKASGQKDGTTVQGALTEIRDGDPRFLAMVFQCVDKRLQILGVSTRSVQLTGPGGGPIKLEDVTHYDDLPTEDILELERVLAKHPAVPRVTLPAANNAGTPGGN